MHERTRRPTHASASASVLSSRRCVRKGSIGPVAASWPNDAGLRSQLAVPGVRAPALTVGDAAMGWRMLIETSGTLGEPVRSPL